MVLDEAFDYEDENGEVLFQVRRQEFKYPDGSYELKDGKHHKIFTQHKADPDRPGNFLDKLYDARPCGLSLA